MKKTILMLLENPFITDNRVSREITSLIETGYKVILVCWDREKRYEKNTVSHNGSLEIHRIKFYAKRGKGFIYLTYKYLIMNLLMVKESINKKFDIIHSHNIETILAGRLIKIIKNKPLFYDAHEIIGIYHSRLQQGGGHLVCWIEKTLSKIANTVIVVTPGMLRLFKERGYKNNIVSIENYPSVKNFDIRNGSRSDSKLVVVGRIGTISRISNIDLIISVIRLLKNKGCNIKIVFAGPISMNYDESFYQLINVNNDICEYLGIIPSKDLKKVYKQIDISISIPTPIPESKYGYASKAFESMAAGVPIIHSAQGENECIISDAQCGIIVDELNTDTLFKAFDTLISNPQLRNDMSNNGYESFKNKYNWEKISDKLINLYNQY